ncbi:hypothetical protein [Microbispora sp. KK1-11]|uniref:hypothetical protein n=1 Tax=Microbispora sp. KK1-11 TaxID=2053005 RepID=UPI0011590121|nr:hypothetical protein [Microbispora sp. KK1-11]TQS28034.1 hypothetical protein FLW16_16565 [Microbispora sp. KK1-11]
MCGACGGPPADWAGPLVSGHRRRWAVARFAGAVCTGVRVRTVPQGWLVSGSTGGARVAPTLDRLLDHVARFLVPTGWDELEAALRDHEHGTGHEDDAHPGYRPPPAPHPPAAVTVMSVPSGGALHLRLAAFGLGVRAFDRRAVALDAPGRAAPFRLLAADGRIVGADPV